MFSQNKTRAPRRINDAVVVAINDSSDATSPSFVRRCQQSLSNLVTPPSCLGCQSTLPPCQNLQLCSQCQIKIVDRDRLPSECHFCSARSRFQIDDERGCHFCRDLDMPFSSVTSIGNYQGALRDHVVCMKSRRGQNTAIQFGIWLAELTRQSIAATGNDPKAIDYVVPMPSHWMRRVGRGHNVAALLAESFARLDMFRNRSHCCLAVTRRTRKQGTLTMNQRFKNVRGSLMMRGNKDLSIDRMTENGLPVSPRILLIDDVMTSGATAIQAANVLREAGAGQIHLAVVARAVGQTV